MKEEVRIQTGEVEREGPLATEPYKGNTVLMTLTPPFLLQLKSFLYPSVQEVKNIQAGHSARHFQEPVY